MPLPARDAKCRKCLKRSGGHVTSKREKLGERQQPPSSEIVMLKAQSNLDSDMTSVNLPNNSYYVAVCHGKVIPLYSLHFLGK